MFKKRLNALRGKFDPTVDFRHYWSQQDIIMLADEDKRITKDTVITGTSTGVILIDNDINLLITGKFQGTVIGLSNNTVTVIGEFNGLLSAKQLAFKNPSKIQGTVFFEKFSIELGVVYIPSPIDREISSEIDQAYSKTSTI